MCCSSTLQKNLGVLGLAHVSVTCQQVFLMKSESLCGDLEITFRLQTTGKESYLYFMMIH